MSNIARRNSLEFEISPFDNGEIGDDIIPTHADDIQNKTEENILRILWILLFSNIYSILLIILPVQFTLGNDNLYYKYDGWYGINDILRLAEPVGGVMFSFWIYYSSGFYSKSSHHEIQLCNFIYIFGVSLYCQGGALHSASVMFKHAVEIYKQDHPGEQYLTDLMYWIRTTWEHEISHYMYAAGAALMAAVIAWAYRDLVLRRTNSDQLRQIQILVVLNAIIYGLLIAAVAIDFPSGLIVGLIYLIGYGLGFVGRYVWYNDGISTKMFGRRPLLNYFHLSYLIALIIIALWIIFVGGFKSRAQAMG